MRVGLYLGLVQWLFALTWTIYVAFLPQLAAGAGIGRKWVIWILMLDQFLFAVMDLGLGIAFDRVAAGMRRLSGAIVMVSALSCLAFLLLPQTSSATPLIALIVVWSLTSSALRAPPMVLLAKYAPPAQTPWLAQLSLLGLGVAGPCAPLLTGIHRAVHPRAPFALASVGLLAAVLGLSWCERRLSGVPAPGSAPASAGAAVWGGGLVGAVLLLALGFQVHTSLNSAPAFARLAAPQEMVYLLPLIWVAFSLAIATVSALTRRFGAAPVLLAGALLGSAALAYSGLATQLGGLIAAQLAAGVAWALVVGAAVPAAIAAGRSGAEGRNTGLVFSALAVAAVVRLAMVAAELNKSPDAAGLLLWLPAALWAAAALLCAFLRRSAPSQP